MSYSPTCSCSREVERRASLEWQTPANNDGKGEKSLAGPTITACPAPKKTAIGGKRARQLRMWLSPATAGRKKGERGEPFVVPPRQWIGVFQRGTRKKQRATTARNPPKSQSGEGKKKAAITPSPQFLPAAVAGRKRKPKKDKGRRFILLHEIPWWQKAID